MKKINDSLAELKDQRLKWACRRGMLELDVLLNNFLNEHYFKLNYQEKADFDNLLNCSDPDIFSWLLGHEEAQDEGLKTIIKVIRAHARSRFQS